MQLTTGNKIGLGLAALLGLADVLTLFTPAPEGDVGPPTGILVLGTILGVITIAGVVVAFRTGGRGAVRVAAGSRALSVLTALPAFFVDVPAGVKVAVGVFVLLTIVSVVLSLTPSRAPALVTD